MATLEDRLDAIEHRRVKLTDCSLPADERPCHRPDVSVWASHDTDYPGDAIVTLSMAATFGEPLRFASLTPDEARKLARLLTEVADAIDAEVGAVESVPQTGRDRARRTLAEISGSELLR